MQALQARADEYPAENDDFDMFGEGPSSKTAGIPSPYQLNCLSAGLSTPRSGVNCPCLVASSTVHSITAIH